MFSIAKTLGYLDKLLISFRPLEFWRMLNSQSRNKGHRSGRSLWRWKYSASISEAECNEQRIQENVLEDTEIRKTGGNYYDLLNHFHVLAGELQPTRSEQKV